MPYRARPNLRSVKVTDLMHPCPAAGGRARTTQPSARLDRWQILRDLLYDAWANPNTDTDDLLRRHLDALSPLEADLVRRMFLNVGRAFDIPAGAAVEEGRRFGYDAADHGVAIGLTTTFTVTRDDDSVEHVRLRTGRRPTSTEEAAVIHAGAEPGDGFIDLMAWTGEVEPISRPTDTEEVLARMLATSPSLAGSGVRPGPACVGCSRAARCGAFPAERVAPTNARTLNLTKTDLEALGRCQRRVAWRRVHGIPRDDIEDGGVSGGVALGRMFHTMVATAEGGPDPDGAVSAYLDRAPPSEVDALRLMWDHHRRLMDDEGLVTRRVEYPVGVTLLDGVGGEMTGVTVMAFLDITARAPEGHPVAVELKTGSPDDSGIENDLYALGLRRWLPDDHPAVIHRHLVGASPPRCEIVTVPPEATPAAADRVRRLTAVTQTWDWNEPLQPSYVVGGWCGSCEFRVTCESRR